MLITNKIKFTRPKTTFLGDRLEYKKAFKYLGVLLDHIWAIPSPCLF